jgi:hypothetical protein
MDIQRYRLLIKRAVIVLVALVFAFFVLGQILESVACRSRLRVLHFDVRTYREKHDEHYPPNIFCVANAFHSNVWSPIEFTNNILGWDLLSCPGVGRKLLAAPTNVDECDYAYVNWEPFFGTNTVPNDYPLIYDRRLSNHKGLGINVLTTTSCFWDYRARWLKAFAASHPEYHLPIPE